MLLTISSENRIVSTASTAEKLAVSSSAVRAEPARESACLMISCARPSSMLFMASILAVIALNQSSGASPKLPSIPLLITRVRSSSAFLNASDDSLAL